MDENFDVERIALNTPASLFWMDRNHKYVGCNIECCNVAGLIPQEILGKDIFELSINHPFLRSIAKELYEVEEYVMSEKIIDYKTHIINAEEGQIKQLCARAPIVSIQGNVVGMIGVAIFNRAYALKAKPKLDNLTEDHFFVRGHPTVKYSLREIFNLAPCSFFWMDRDHQYLGCNAETVQVLGLRSRYEFIHHTIIDIARKKKWPDFKGRNIYDLDESIMHTGFPEYSIEAILPKGNGSVYNWGAKKPIFNNKHEIIGLTGAALYAGEFGSLKGKGLLL